jgi:general secretion pathway protein J
VRADSRGFTLLEMVISISLMALLMVALLVGLRVANRAWQRGEARLRQVHIEGEREAFLTTQISSLVPYAVTSSIPDIPGKATILQATPSCLRFVTRYNSRFRNRAGLVLAEYAVVRTSPGPLGLALREAPVRDEQALLGQLIERVARDEDSGKMIVSYRPFFLKRSDIQLLTGLDRAGFEYLDLHPKDGDGPRWLGQWESTPETPYPAAIRLHWGQSGRETERIIPIRAQALPK